MRRATRRTFLAGAASGLAALAGCSRLPVVGDGEQRVEYDSGRLRGIADPESLAPPATYPGTVPDALAEAHYDRALELLEAVQREPLVPNEAVAERLVDEREWAADAVSEPPSDVSTVDALGGWRYDRADAAEVNGAYRAANGDVTAADLSSRRSAVRADLATFREDWAYRAATPVEAFAVHRHVEELVARSQDRLAPRHPFPDDPKTAVFEVGELARSVEYARSALDDAAGLLDAYRTDAMAPHWEAVATAAVRLREAIYPTRRRVEPYADRDASADDFRRNLDGTPAERLFVEVRQVALSGVDSANVAEERGDYAAAVTDASRALVGLLALESVVDAIHDGEYGRPESTDAVVAARERAFDAVEDALAVEPAAVATVVAGPARWWLRDAEEALGERQEYEAADETPDERDVVRAVAHYALAEQVADAAPAVVDRVTAELTDASR